MAVLSDPDRADCAADYIRRTYGDCGIFAGVTKADIRAAINAIDQFLNDNAGAINSTIPLPARSNLTTAQKAILLIAVVTKRYIAGV